MTGFAASDELLALGRGAARDGDPEQARFYLEWFLRDAPADALAADAWYWLGRIATTAGEQRRCLERALILDPRHPESRRDLAILDGRLRPEEIIDPNTPPAPLVLAGPVPRESTERPRCPQCGGALRFAAGERALACQFCGYRGPGQDARAVEEQDWVAAIYTARGHRWVLPGEQTLTCQGCGAVQSLPPGAVSATCAYCASPQLLRAPALADLIAPEGIAPFALVAGDARERARRWLADRPFSPGDLPARAALGQPRAIYFPCWTFDLEGEVRWCGVARRLMLQASDCALDAEDFGLVGLLLGQQRRPVGGSDPVAFDDLLVPATPSVPGALLRQLHFDTQTLLPYAAEYLLGWPAEVYRIPVAEASLAARELALAVHREEAAQVAHTDVEDFAIERVELSIASYKLVLLPLWIVGYRYDGYSYPLLVNGQTGTAAGEAPRGALGTALAALAGAGD